MVKIDLLVYLKIYKSANKGIIMTYLPIFNFSIAVFNIAIAVFNINEIFKIHKDRNEARETLANIRKMRLTKKGEFIPDEMFETPNKRCDPEIMWQNSLFFRTRYCLVRSYTSKTYFVCKESDLMIGNMNSCLDDYKTAHQITNMENPCDIVTYETLGDLLQCVDNYIKDYELCKGKSLCGIEKGHQTITQYFE